MPIIRRRSTVTIDGDHAGSDRPRRVPQWRWIGKAALIVASGSAALALAGPMGLRPLVDTAEAAGAAGQVTVAFVIDFGKHTTPVVGCVSVPDSDNRYAALSAFLVHEGMAEPRYDSNGSGLLCAINAVPSTGCGQISSGHYVYWSYFTGGTGGWTYASTGAFGTVTPGDVEGWRFQNPGKGNPGDPAPRVAPQFDAICAADTATTTTTTTGAPIVTTTTHPQPGSDPLGQRKGATLPPGGANPAGHSSTTTGAPTTTRPSNTSSTSTTSSNPSITSPPAVSVPGAPVALSVTGHPAGASGPGPAPLIIGGLLITALGIAGFTRWRRRPRTP